MKFSRKRSASEEQPPETAEETPEPEAAPEVAGVRANGPWDIDEVELEDWGVGGLPVEDYRRRVRASANPQDA